MDHIDFTPEQRAFIREGIAEGRFASEDDAVQEALALWVDRERRRLDILAAVDKSEASLASGRGRMVTTPEEADQFFDDIKRRVAAAYADQTPGR